MLTDEVLDGALPFEVITGNLGDLIPEIYYLIDDTIGASDSLKELFSKLNAQETRFTYDKFLGIGEYVETVNLLKSSFKENIEELNETFDADTQYEALILYQELEDEVKVLNRKVPNLTKEHRRVMEIFDSISSILWERLEDREFAKIDYYLASAPDGLLALARVDRDETMLNELKSELKLLNEVVNERIYSSDLNLGETTEAKDAKIIWSDFRELMADLEIHEIINSK